MKLLELPGLEASGARAIAERLAVMVGGRVLDVCTGKGDFIEMLMKTLKEFDCFVGVDIADDDLAVAREKFQDRAFQFFEMDAEHLDFVDISFDMVCIANSVHHLTNMSRVLTEMKRVLKPGGWFIVEEMYRDGEQSEAQRTGILEHHWTAKVDRLLGVPHNETLTKNQIVQALDVLQFKNLEVLDSSRRVKCLFCPDRFDCEDPKSESNVTSFIKGIDKTLQQLAPNERLANIVEEAEQLKLLVQKTGFADASIVFVIGRK